MEIRKQVSRYSLYFTASVIVLLVLAPFDISIARFLDQNRVSHGVTRFIELLANIGGGGFGAFGILLLVATVFQVKMVRLPRMISATLGAGLLADLLKLCVHRARPRALDLSTATFASTFRGWFPFISAGSAGQSFPSGHSATAAGLAFTLAVIYPRGRWGFAAIAISTAISRVVVHAHFPTDVVIGSIIGAAWAYECHLGIVAFGFERFETAFENTMHQQRIPTAEVSN